MGTPPLDQLLADIEQSGLLQPDADLLELAARAQNWILALIAAAKEQQQLAEKNRRDLAELNLAIVEWANARGQGPLFFQEIQLCLEIVRRQNP